jgi:hypothetical protein
MTGDSAIEFISETRSLLFFSLLFFYVYVDCFMSLPFFPVLTCRMLARDVSDRTITIRLEAIQLALLDDSR